jgi:hypothetical protein
MKNILKHFTFIAVAFLVTVSCDYDDTQFELLTNDPDASATYYIQFKDASKFLQTGVDENGDLVDIETTIIAGLLGLPQAQDITVNFAVDPSTTIDPSMYTLSASSITIPAGSTSGSVTVRTNTELMPIGETLKFVLNVDAGANTATAGTQLSYDMERINFCLLDISEYVGTWTGTDSWGYATEVVTTLVGTDLYMDGIGYGWFQDWWGEVIVTNTPVKVNINLITGDFSIDRADQTVPYVTSTWNGAPQPTYNIFASGKITSTCDQILEFEYTWDQEGAFYDGLAWGPRFKEVITKN